jgi:hypothetical protein
MQLDDSKLLLKCCIAYIRSMIDRKAKWCTQNWTKSFFIIKGKHYRTYKSTHYELMSSPLLHHISLHYTTNYYYIISLILLLLLIYTNNLNQWRLATGLVAAPAAALAAIAAIAAATLAAVVTVAFVVVAVTAIAVALLG